MSSDDWLDQPATALAVTDDIDVISGTYNTSKLARFLLQLLA
jgi:hypothetical protein